ncbi:MAG: Mrr restriction system protein [Pseudorhodoplanes sp.]|nr:Mrr restriction system protein [Pseudorhodoplanes sp.]
MNQIRTTDRGNELLKIAFEILRGKPDGLRPRDLYREIEGRVKLNEFDLETMQGSGLPRWRATMHFKSVAAVKAGLITKLDGRWILTEEGARVASLSTEELKQILRSRYREWKKTRREAEGIEVVEEEEEPSERISVLFEDAKEKAREEIDGYLDTLGPYEFQELVAALLEAMGYATNTIAARGPDGGTDILAYTDPIGARTPHIRVQVKHRNQAAAREEIAALRGIIRADREIGLFVSSGGFTRDARREAGSGSVHIELVDLDRFLELWLQYYDKLKETARAKLRLEPVYFLAPEID